MRTESQSCTDADQAACLYSLNSKHSPTLLRTIGIVLHGFIFLEHILPCLFHPSPKGGVKTLTWSYFTLYIDFYLAFLQLNRATFYYFGALIRSNFFPIIYRFSWLFDVIMFFLSSSFPASFSFSVLFLVNSISLLFLATHGFVFFYKCHDRLPFAL